MVVITTLLSGLRSLTSGNYSALDLGCGIVSGVTAECILHEGHSLFICIL
jgi:hypothetical protein